MGCYRHPWVSEAAAQSASVELEAGLVEFVEAVELVELVVVELSFDVKPYLLEFCHLTDDCDHCYLLLYTLCHA